MNRIGEIINRVLIEQFIAKGHKLSDGEGSFVKSLRYEITDNGDNVIIEGFGNHYAKFLERGVPASNVPYSGRSGKGGTSKYIEGLARYAQLRMGINDKREALGAAFAIANKHKKMGIRIRERGRGSKFITDAFNDPKIEQVITQEAGIMVNKKIDGVFNKYFK